MGYMFADDDEMKRAGRTMAIVLAIISIVAAALLWLGAHWLFPYISLRGL